MKKAFPADHAVPISKAVRAGDFVYTSAYGPWVFDPTKLTYDDAGVLIDDGTGNKDMPFDQQVHKTFDFVKAALAIAGCTLDDVIKSECWLTDQRDFGAFNAIYKTYFKKDPPVRSIFPMRFNFCCRVEIQVTAYKPLKGSAPAKAKASRSLKGAKTTKAKPKAKKPSKGRRSASTKVKARRSR
jgi:enamine deaminase RidA (YjgF/YER057c/UK114 family)